MKTEQLLIVVSGFSGVGKGTLMKALLEKYPDEYALSISATSRSPREGEEEGVHYFFKSKDEFASMIENNELLEHAQYSSNYYGTPKEYVFSQMKQGKDVILEIEVQGGLLVKEQFPEALLLFVVPPSAKELKNRLTGRGTENAQEIEKRLARAVEESLYIQKYDYVVLNDNLEECLLKLHQLIQNQHTKVSHCQEFISTLKKELEPFAKGE